MTARRFLLFFLTQLVIAFAFCVPARAAVPEEARVAFTAGDYPKAIEILNRVAAAEPRDASVQHLLARCYFESEQYDRAISAAEASLAIEPDNSAYHELLGRAYGEKADHSGGFSALSLAKKARREFETAVRLDQHNFSVAQALIEYDCSAPGIAGGGEDKARPEIDKLRALDLAEGIYAEGNCRRQKKDFTAADEKFRKAIALHPKSADLLFDIADYYMKRNQPEQLKDALEAGQRLAPSDPRGPFFRAVVFAQRKENAAEASRVIREYIVKAPRRNNYPSKAMAHYWLGQILENENNADSAKREYQEALNLEPKNRFANEALKRLHD
jgi:tetratricopeptide (TPR) repeat protein